MKTISSRVLEYKESEFKNDKRFAISYEQQIICCVNDFKAGVEFAQRWIPVEEELPTEDGKYLVKGKYGIFINYYNGFHECWDDEDGDDYSSDLIGGKVTHWRYIELK